MVEVLKFIPAILLVCGPPLIAGFVGAQVVGWFWTAGLAAMAIVTTVTEPENYDMPGLGLRVFGVAAVLALLALIVGSALRRARASRRATEG